MRLRRNYILIATLLLVALMGLTKCQGSIVLDVVCSDDVEVQVRVKDSVQAMAAETDCEPDCPSHAIEKLRCEKSGMGAISPTISIVTSAAIVRWQEFRIPFVPPLESELLIRDWVWIPDCPVLKLLKVPVS